MEKKSYISSYQIVLFLLITRILFSNSYQAGLNAGNCIQDILPSFFVNFLTNFIVAIPILMLLRRHPEHDLVECSIKALGRGFGIVIAILYFLFFTSIAAVNTGNFDNFFVNTVIPDVTPYAINIFLIIVCIYGAIKGIESIARVGSVAGVLYLLTLFIVLIALIPYVNLGYLKPLFYNGPKYFIGGSLMNYSLSFQIVSIAFLGSFKCGEKGLSKTYYVWNVITFIVLFLPELYFVTVLGAFGAKQFYPQQALYSLVKINVFERIDALTFIPWILNVVITVTLYIYFAVTCMLKIGLNKYRKIITVITGIIVFFASPFISRHFTMLQQYYTGVVAAVVNTFFVVIIPTFILLADVVSERLVQNEEKG